MCYHSINSWTFLISFSDMLPILRPLVFFTLIILSLQFELNEDNSLNGVILKSNGKINILEKEKLIAYAINISILDKLANTTSMVENECPNEIKYLDSFNKKLNAITKIKSIYNAKQNTNNSIAVNTFNSLNLLREDFNKLEFANTSERCKIFRNLIAHLSRVFLEIDKLIKQDFSTLNETLILNKLKGDVRLLLNKYDQENTTYPFAFTGDFKTQFLSNTNFSLRFDDNIMLMIFKIPLFKKFQIFEIFPKPIIKGFSSFLLELESQFVCFDNMGKFLFNNNDIDNLCFVENNEKFCKVPSIKNDCDNEYVSFENITSLNSKCFRKFPNENTVTQLYSTFYFSIIYPIEITVGCGDNILPLYLKKSSKLDLGNCSIKSPFFEHDSNFKSIAYKIYISKHSNKDYNEWFKNLLTQELKNKYILRSQKFDYLILSYLILLTIIGSCAIYLTKKNMLREEVSFYVPTQDIDSNHGKITSV